MLFLGQPTCHFWHDLIILGAWIDRRIQVLIIVICVVNAMQLSSRSLITAWFLSGYRPIFELILQRLESYWSLELIFGGTPEGEG